MLSAFPSQKRRVLRADDHLRAARSEEWEERDMRGNMARSEPQRRRDAETWKSLKMQNEPNSSPSPLRLWVCASDRLVFAKRTHRAPRDFVQTNPNEANTNPRFQLKNGETARFH